MRSRDWPLIVACCIPAGAIVVLVICYDIAAAMHR